MRITFLIGNGFDLNLGLYTRYEDFYPYFLEHADKNNMIRNWIDGNEQFWSDLEEKLGQEISKVKENELIKFYEDKDELDELLLQYLENEQEKFKIEDEEYIKNVLKKSLESFSIDFSEIDKESILNTKTSYKNETFIYEFISFSYTNTLDKVVSLFDKSDKIIGTHISGVGHRLNNLLGNVLHIHGTVEEEMILGVNDVSQINNEFLKENSIFLRTFIKSKMNNSIGQKKVERTNEIINDSHIICVFGMSLGNTDKMWWEKLIQWLINNKQNKLVLFIKQDETKIRRKLPAQIIRIIEKTRRELFEKGKGQYSDNEFENIENRIIVEFNSKIFSFVDNN